MGMDLCYYGIKEEEIPKILDGNFEEDFSELEPSYTTRVFSAKDFFKSFAVFFIQKRNYKIFIV